MWVSFALYNDDGTPRTTGTPSFSKYLDRVGGILTPPTLFNRGGGVYGFDASVSDIAVGVSFLVVDNSVPSALLYVSGVVGDRLYGFALYDSSGAPLASATPAFATYIDSLGAPLAQPTILNIGGGLYAFNIPDSVFGGGSYEINSGASAYPARVFGTLEDPVVSSGGSALPVDGTVIETIRAQLLADSGMVSLIVDRVYPQVAPQDTDKPFIVLTVVTEVPYSTFDGSVATRLRQARLQVDSYATTYLKARQVAAQAEVVIASLSRPDLSATCDTIQDLYEDETQLHRVTADYIVML